MLLERSSETTLFITGLKVCFGTVIAFIKDFHPPPTGLEPAIPGYLSLLLSLGGRCLIHWATEAVITSISSHIAFVDKACKVHTQRNGFTLLSCRILGSIVVSIPACHAGDRGSIPRRGG